MRNRRLITYLAITCVAAAGSFLLSFPARAAVHTLIATAGITVLIVRIVHHRPARARGWWLIAVSGLLLLAEAVAIAAIYGMRAGVTLAAALPLVLGVLAFSALAAGLAVLGWRSAGARGWDALDATMTALGGFLVAWVLYVNPRLATTTSALVAVSETALPIAALLVLTLGVKLALGGGLRTWSGRLLLLAVLAGLVQAGLGAIPVGAEAIELGLTATLAWLAYAVLLGAAAVADDFGTVGAAAHQPAPELPRWRMILFILLALLAPVDVAVELARAGPTGPAAASILVPVLCAAVIFLVLVVRVQLIALVAHARAQSLGQAMAEQEELQRQLAFRALHDPLTGLANRRVLTDRMDWLRDNYGGPGYRAGRGQALMMLDLDGFKDINDTFGHPVGDRLLVDVAARLRSATPDDAVVVRLGGDEFAVLLADTSAAAARQCAGEILQALRSPYLVAGQELFLSASLGLLIPKPGQPSQGSSAGLRDVDQALYAAKTAGRNRYVEFHPQMLAERLHQARTGAGLRNAISRNELVLHYQPIVSLREDDAIVAVEALVRWRPGGGELISPAEFIPAAERSGLIIDIGAWVLRQACREAGAWCARYGTALGVNVSGRQLDDPHFADLIQGCLDETGLPGSALIIELTESSLITSTTDPAMHAQLDRLRELGVKIAIDDFGTGYSSLSYIARLPVDMVKIDSSFTENPSGADLPQQSWSFVRAILELISSLGLNAVAEGIETREQAEALRALNCPLAQGYYFSEPKAAEQIEELLRTSAPSRSA